MFDPYNFLKTEACAVLRSSVYQNAAEHSINCCSQGFEISTPLPLILNEDANLWVKKIKPSQYFDHTEAVGGHVCFKLSAHAYEYCTNQILKEFESTVLPTLETAATQEEYAYMRMKMLSNKNRSSSVFSDSTVQAALWACFALISQSTKAALSHACKKVLDIGENLSAQERFCLKENCKDIGICTALLIYRRLDLE